MGQEQFMAGLSVLFRRGVLYTLTIEMNISQCSLILVQTIVSLEFGTAYIILSA